MIHLFGAVFSQRELPQYGSSTQYVKETLSACRNQHILLNLSGREVTLTDEAANRMKQYADATNAGMVYSDYIKTMGADATIPAPLIDIQSGSLRDDFAQKLNADPLCFWPDSEKEV